MQEQLGEALDTLGDSGFSGKFSSHQSYADAPNPCMRVEGLGIVGLPLDSNAAERLKARCNLAPFGKGAHTVIDQTVRNTWEVDRKQVRFRPASLPWTNACQVSFDNPAWKVFLGRVMREACETLGIDFDDSKPRCKLHKLLLYETGSQYV